jgi:hypothetical protein
LTLRGLVTIMILSLWSLKDGLTLVLGLRVA